MSQYSCPLCGSIDVALKTNVGKCNSCGCVARRSQFRGLSGSRIKTEESEPVNHIPGGIHRIPIRYDDDA